MLGAEAALFSAHECQMTGLGTSLKCLHVCCFVVAFHSTPGLGAEGSWSPWCFPICDLQEAGRVTFFHMLG